MKATVKRAMNPGSLPLYQQNQRWAQGAGLATPHSQSRSQLRLQPRPGLPLTQTAPKQQAKRATGLQAGLNTGANTGTKAGQNAASRADGVSLQGHWHEVLRQAEICCEQARLAVRQQRLLSGCGLMATALALYHHVLKSADAAISAESKAEIHEQVASIEHEMALYRELHKSYSRPLAA